MRARSHVDALWEALADGSIQQVSSDHAPFRYEGQKTGGCDNFTQIPNGLPGVETRLPIVFTEGVGKGRLTPERFVELTATAPAQIFGLTSKGRIEPGADADGKVIVHGLLGVCDDVAMVVERTAYLTNFAQHVGDAS